MSRKPRSTPRGELETKGGAAGIEAVAVLGQEIRRITGRSVRYKGNRPMLVRNHDPSLARADERNRVRLTTAEKLVAKRRHIVGE